VHLVDIAVCSSSNEEIGLKPCPSK
jgi:hypothetical protein